MKFEVSIGQVQYHQKIITIVAKDEKEARRRAERMLDNNVDDVNCWGWDTQTDCVTKIVVKKIGSVSGETCAKCGAGLIGIVDNQITGVCPVCGRTTAICANCEDHGNCYSCPYRNVTGNTFNED